MCFRFAQPLAITVVVLFTGSVLADATRPNIIFVYTDDQAPTAVGAAGNTQIRTPNMDRLFREGASLVNSFVTTPVCSPSRAGLMTSRYGTELGILDYLNQRAEPEHGLDPKTVTWSEVLASAGYSTGLVGKWHLGTDDRFHPTRTGYQYFMEIRTGWTTPKDPVLEVDGETKTVPGFTADVLTDFAIKFLRRQQRQTSFLLSLHFRAPHARWLPVRDEDWEPYQDLDPEIPNPDFPHLDVEKVKRMTREYMASVSSVDRNLGRLFDVVDELRLRNNTIIVFTSDHGYNMGHHGVWYKGNAQWQLTQLPPQRWPDIGPIQRPNLFDQSLRVPTAVYWPGVIESGTVVTHTISNLDWYPTLLAMAGAGVPKDVLTRGHNFLPLLRGEEIEWDNDLYCEYSMRHGAKTHMRGYRTPKWKLMIDFQNSGREELYNLVDDPSETKNLASSINRHIVAVKDRLRRKILAQMCENSDPALKLLAGKP